MVNGGGVSRPTEHPCFIAQLGDQLISGTSAGDAFNFDGTAQNFRGCFSSVLPISASAVAAGGDAFTDIGPKPPTAAATSDGYRCIAYVRQDNVMRIIVLAPDGSTIYSSTKTVPTPFNYAATRVVVVGSVFYVCFFNTNLFARELVISAGTVTASADTQIGAPYGFDPQWDASSFDGTNWFFVYQQAAGNVRIKKMNGLALDTSADFAAPPSLLSIWADATNQKVWIGVLYDYAGGATADQEFTLYTSALALVLPLTSIFPILFNPTVLNSSPPLFGPCYSAVSPTSALCLLSIYATAPVRRTLFAFTVTPAGAFGAVEAYGHLMPISKPDAKQRAWCLVSDLPETNNLRALLVRFPDAGIASSAVGVGRAIIEAAAPEFTNPGGLAPYLSFGDGFHEISRTDDDLAMPISITVATESNVSGVEATLQVQLFKYADSGTEPHREAKSGGNSLLISGQPTEFAPQRERFVDSSMGAIEAGFAFAPAILDTTVTPGGGTQLAAGSYAYVVVMQWPDSLGRRKLSKPSVPVVVTVTTPSSVLLNVAYPGIGQHPPTGGTGASGPMPLLYRTTNGGENYQLVPLQPNLVGIHRATFTDTVSDAIIAQNEFLYTDGGVLPNVLAPTCRFMVAAEDRVWCGGLWDQTILEASKVRVPQEPINFTGDATHQVVLPEACTGLAYQDGQVVAFAESAIYLVGGDGPNDQGAGSFLPPRLLVRGIGCIDYKTIIETPIGILFQSNIGLYLLPRGFSSPQYIGMPVMDTITSSPTILSSALTITDEFTLARFLLSDSGHPYGTDLLTLDIDSGQWFLDRYNAAGGSLKSFSEVGQGTSGALLLRYDLTSSANPIWVEDETVFSDAGAADVGASTFVARTIQTSWVYPFGLGGWGMVNKFVLSMAHDYPTSSGLEIDTLPEDVTVTIETDDLDTSEAKTWSVAGAFGAGGNRSASYRGFDLASRKSTCFRATVTESTVPADGQVPGARGPKFLGLTFEIDNGGGIRMLTAAERS